MKQAFTVLSFLLCIFSVNAQNCFDTIYSGRATFYTSGASGNNCSLPLDSPRYSAAINSVQYNNSIYCGGCIAITSYKGTTVMPVADQCFGCAYGDLDINEDAMNLISAMDTPTAIQWRFTGCPVTGPIQFIYQGSNPYYAKIQVRNHRYPVQSLEYKSGSNYYALERVNDNYFVYNTGFGANPVELRITDILGDAINATGIPVVNDSVINGQEQFPVCTPTGIKDMEANPANLLIKNNPSADGQFIIVNRDDDQIVYSLTDMQGRTLIYRKINAQSQENLEVQESGLYILNYVTTGGKRGIVKIISTR